MLTMSCMTRRIFVVLELRKILLFQYKTRFIKHPMPSSSWILKESFMRIMGGPSIADGIDLDLSFRITKYLKKGYFYLIQSVQQTSFRSRY